MQAYTRTNTHNIKRTISLQFSLVFFDKQYIKPTGFTLEEEASLFDLMIYQTEWP